MRKMIAILLTVLLCVGISYASADDTKTFEPELTNIIGFSANKWFSDADYRALLTISIALDYAKVDNSFEPSVIFEDGSYVAYDDNDNTLFIVFFRDDEYCIVLYSPSMETAIYDGEWSKGAEATIELAFDRKDMECRKNTISRLSNMLDVLGNALEDL